MSRRSLAALLPIKAHSARIPDKNFRSFAGKPLFHWILETLLSIEAIDKIIVNTDARERLTDLGLPEDARLLVRDRQDDLRGDEVSMNRIIEDDIATIPADLYLMTHCTNPLLRRSTIEAAMAAFDSADNDSLFSVNRVQSRFYRRSGEPVNHDPDNLLPTQDLEPWFEENSCLYLFTRESFSTAKARIGTRPLLFEIPRTEAVDIDIPEDWEVAEAIALNRASHNNQ